MKPRYRVTFWESERGWGRKILTQEDFETKAEAEAAANEVNSKNTLDRVPDYYIFADAPEFVDADENPIRY
jgi:hypothetical protein